jgi:thiamine-phosphate diphosphorylase
MSTADPSAAPEAALPPLHVVTDDAVVARPGFFARAGEVAEAGGALLALHVRAPAASGREAYDLACRMAEAAWRAGSHVFVNDRMDVALAVEADGAQLAGRSLSVLDARIIVGDEMRLGASVHSLEAALEARDDGADFVIAGSVYETASHPGRPAAGVDLIERIAALEVPVVAIGGITPERVRDLRDAGAAGVAAIRGIWDAEDPARAVQRYLDAWLR